MNGWASIKQGWPLLVRHSAAVVEEPQIEPPDSGLTADSDIFLKGARGRNKKGHAATGLQGET